MKLTEQNHKEILDLITKVLQGKVIASIIRANKNYLDSELKTDVVTESPKINESGIIIWDSHDNTWFIENDPKTEIDRHSDNGFTVKQINGYGDALLWTFINTNILEE